MTTKKPSVTTQWLCDHPDDVPPCGHPSGSAATAWRRKRGLQSQSAWGEFKKQQRAEKRAREDWRARSDRHWRAIGELYLEILTEFCAKRGLPPPNRAVAIVKMRADAKRRADEMFGE